MGSVPILHSLTIATNGPGLYEFTNQARARVFHHTLRFARFLPFPLGRLEKPAHKGAGWFHAFGSDLGGMRVRATGRGLTKTWDLIAPDGHGPKMPVCNPLPFCLAT